MENGGIVALKEKISAILIVAFLLSTFTGAGNGQEWDFPRLDELLFKIKYPYPVSLDAAQACEIDTYVGAIRTIEVDILAGDPHNWTVTAAPGFHMCYIAINCRDVAPSTSGQRLDYHDRTQGFELYPLNISAFRYALELIVGDDKDAWIWDMFQNLKVRLDTVVPPANVYWYNPEISQYPKDWALAYQTLIDAGFSGTIGGDDWTMPNGQPLRKPIYAISPESSLEEMELTRKHARVWNQFFCGQDFADLPHNCNFVHEPLDYYDIIDIVFYDRDHDIFCFQWSLDREPDYLWDFFHPDADIPDGSNSPGLDYRPLNAMIDAFKRSIWTEKTELRMYGPGPITVPEDTLYQTDFAIATGSEDLWIGVHSGVDGHSSRISELEYGIDYIYLVSGGRNIGIHFMKNIALDHDMYLHMVYTLEDRVLINDRSDLKQVCYDIQWMLYYMCPYLPIHSRNYHDLFKPGLESWVPSLGFGAATYQLPWTYGSIHWTGVPVGGSIQWHLPGPVNTFHPYRATSVSERTILNRLYNNMLEVDAYTHSDVPMCAIDYRIYEWVAPSGEQGMKITWWIRNDLYWQDGDHITADDFIWQYEFINSIQPSQLHNAWGCYHGCEKHNDYCFSIYVNTTGLWNFYAYAIGPIYPQKIWAPYYGDSAGADAFRPWEVPHPTVPGMTSLYGTGEWILDYYDSILGIIRMYKNVNWWGRLAAQPCRQIPGVHTPTNANLGNLPKVTTTVVGLHTFNLDAKEACFHSWTLKIDGIVVCSGSRTLAPLASVNWYQTIPWMTLANGIHTFRLETANPLGTNAYETGMCTLVGDVDNNNIVNMWDMYLVSTKIGQSGPPCWIPEDVNNDGVVNPLDADVISYRMTSEIHDVSVTDVSPLKTVAGQSWATSINVSIVNEGNQHGTDIAVTLYANGSTVQTMTIPSLLAGEQTNLTFTWNTNGWAKGNYILSAYAWPITSEFDTEDNSFLNGYVSISLAGDVDASHLVNILDLYLVASNFGKRSPYASPEIANYDIDWNGIINTLDLYIAALHFGETDP